ncbi:MAG: lactonase family protein [Tunicatimonas sp.]|uniref:lactonase family protein n=1 Tax=Tunicatimonas sp. TaxID=1940096 RepID=UPI003C733DC0
MNRLKFLFLLLLISFTASAQETLYVGTYSVRGSEGIYVYSFDRDNQSFSLKQTVNTPESPSFLTVSPDGHYLYSANRGGTEEYPDWGSVSSFSIDKKSGELSPINQISSYGISPCHVHIDGNQDWLYVSHYGGGSLSVFPIKNGGSVGSLADSVQHTGSSVNPNRQEAPHVHSIQSIPQSNYFITADLGLDYLKIYEMKDKNALPAPVAYITTEAGAGPRHFSQSKNSSYIYVAEELTSTVSVHYLNIKERKTHQVQRVSTLPEGFSDNNSVADIHSSPDGRFLYVSNRGHNSLAIFEINADTGKLTSRGYQSTLGEVPRNFTIDSQGEFVLVANQNTDNIIFFQRNKENGQLTATGTELSVPSPVCLEIK